MDMKGKKGDFIISFKFENVDLRETSICGIDLDPIVVPKIVSV